MNRKEFFAKKIVDGNNCWNWTGGKYPKGYGYNTNRSVDGVKEVRSHRLSYALTNGEIPKGMSVLHKCDNRACINPDHLYLGTQLENMRDMADRGRGGQPSGARHGMTTLTPGCVARIREAYLFGANQYDLAKYYGVGQSTISRIVRNEVWRVA